MRHLSTSLKQEVSTRWNSVYYLLESVLKNFDEIEHILRTTGESYRLVGIDKLLLQELTNFLEVFKFASEELEATKQPTLHLALPWFYKIKQHCEANDQDSDEMAAIKRRATTFVQTKFVLEPLHHVATVLNPKMKNMKMLQDNDKQTNSESMTHCVSCCRT